MSRFKGQMPEHFLKVDHNTFLSKKDSRFLEKYLKYYPYDGEKRYEYGLHLEKQGKKKDAMSQYHMALKNGYLAAEVRLKELKENKQNKNEEVEDKARKIPIPLILLGLMNVAVFTAIILYFVPIFFDRYQPEAAYSENYINETNATGGSEEASTLLHKNDLVSCEPSEKEKPLFIIALQNGLERFKESTGSYPEKIEDLIDVPPYNWLSMIPSNVRYHLEDGIYNLSWNNEEYASTDPKELLELVHYPDSNQLAVMNGDAMLAIYSVASGVESLPFKESKVYERIVNPNGGTGPLGTRGLVLQDQYAIHGTNEPSTIGQDVTLGCLRLTNEEMETLYPYISMGTPFIVKEGTPKTEPLFLGGLPPLTNQITEEILQNEMRPNVNYNWKR